jgi:hypothetical protein
MPTTIHNSDASEAGILARLLSEGSGQKLPRGLARYILELGFSHEDKQRMHDLAIRNQIDSLSPEEREELLAYAKAGTVLSILKAKARGVIGLKPKKRTRS